MWAWVSGKWCWEATSLDGCTFPGVRVGSACAHMCMREGVRTAENVEWAQRSMLRW